MSVSPPPPPPPPPLPPAAATTQRGPWRRGIIHRFGPTGHWADGPGLLRSLALVTSASGRQFVSSGPDLRLNGSNGLSELGIRKSWRPTGSYQVGVAEEPLHARSNAIGWLADWLVGSLGLWTCETSMKRQNAGTGQNDTWNEDD
ncbi:unnamed protein product [Protopolystoma xenopodis]|uniref:Uncharacterized protein n=1 Tax=Protopolystoma xenopodis TaxID=117903 RepID=A0A448X1I5_9PLAT|nr:unnamed protein product [Protopolystoma xenopodis]